jgi:lipoate-protein ligase B
VTTWARLPGRAPYAQVHALQEALVDARGAGRIGDVVLLLEHEATITVGRARNAAANVLDPRGVPVVAVERGGDVTWHGPGQLVAYPIVALEGARRDLRRFLTGLEQGVIDLLAGHGLAAMRDPRNTGVWLPIEGSEPRKVCSIGVAARRWVTWHGLALNVTPDLSRFAAIHPCGFDATVMTRLADHLDPCPPLDALALELVAPLARALDLAPGPLVTLSSLDPAATIARLSSP